MGCVARPHLLDKLRPEPAREPLPSPTVYAPPRGSPGARSIGYGLWLLRLQPFEDGLQRLDLRRLRLQVEIDEPAQRRDQDRTFVTCCDAAAVRLAGVSGSVAAVPRKVAVPWGLAAAAEVYL